LLVPKLRFKEFKNEWKKEKIKNIVTEIIEKTSNTEKYPLWSLTLEEGVTPKTERYERGFLVKKENNFKIVHFNNFVYNPMNVRLGAVSYHKENVDISVSGYYNIFKINNIQTIGFWDNYLKSPEMIKRYNNIATGSLIEKKRVHYSQFINLIIPLPKEDEQIKISNLFIFLDKKIELQQKKIEALKMYKKGLINKIYNRQYNNKMRLSELIKQKSIRNANNEIENIYSISNKEGFLLQSEQFKDRMVASDDTSNYKIVEKDYFAYNPARINVGSIARMKEEGHGIISPMYICFTCDEKILPDYLEYFYESSIFNYEMNKRLEGSVRMCLSYESMINIPIALPNIEEQEKYAQILNRMDEKIKKEELIYKNQKKLKNGLLQQMFI
jgi:type I restriction enzyme S subunit